MTLNGLTCKEFVELVTEYFEGSMAPEEKNRFEAHLASCKGCETYLDQMAQTIRLTGQLREDQVPEEAQTELLNTFREWKKGRKPAKS
jgi:predicted anti-sigma-YlaC factor YlaD